MKNINIIKGDKLVKNNLYIYFKSKIFYWWDSVFSPEQKPLIKHGEKIENWEQILLKRGKKTSSAVMVTIKDSQYIMGNARRKREPIKFILAITKTIKTINMPVYNHITLIYTGIKLKLRRDLFRSIENTIMDSCFKKKLWWGITTVKKNLLTIHLITSPTGMLIIFVQTSNQVRIIILILENDKMISGMVLRLLLRE